MEANCLRFNQKNTKNKVFVKTKQKTLAKKTDHAIMRACLERHGFSELIKAAKFEKRFVFSVFEQVVGLSLLADCLAGNEKKTENKDCKNFGVA